MERGRLRWERCACGVLANRGADPRNPGRGSVARAGTAETTTGAARPRSLAPASGAVRPPGRWLGAIAGAARRARRTSHHPHVRPRQPPGGPGTARHQLAAPGRPGEATPGGAGRRGWGRECGSRATTPTSWRGWDASAAHARPPPRRAARQSPGGAAVQPPRGAPLGSPRGAGTRTPRGAAPLRRPVLGRPGLACVFDDLHALAPDVSGPLSPGPVRFLIPDQNVRRQRTTRSLTPRASAPCQAAPRMPRP